MSTRPPTPYELDPLTARQEEVLELIGRGRSNPEIADALGISIDGAKWHVREILSKLGVDSREEAAAYWRARRRPTARLRRIFAPLAVGKVGLGTAGVAVASVVAIAVVVGAVAVSLNASADEDQVVDLTPFVEATPTVEPTPTVAASPTPPKFAGTINGIRVGTTDEAMAAAPDGPGPVCPVETSLEFGPDAQVKHSSSPLALPSDAELPPGMDVFEGPSFWVCPGLGVLQSEATIRVKVSVPGAADGTGAIGVWRFARKTGAGVDASAERWSAATIAGHPAAVLRPVVEWVGESVIIVYDESSNVTTFLYGGGVRLESLEELMEVILR